MVSSVLIIDKLVIRTGDQTVVRLSFVMESCSILWPDDIIICAIIELVRIPTR